MKQSINKIQTLIVNMDDSDDSEVEGFIPNKIVIDQKQIQTFEKEPQRYCQFQPHYVLGNIPLKKEPHPCYKYFSDIPLKKCIQNAISPRNNARKCSLTASQIYLQTQQYHNIYSRFKQPFGHGLRSSFEHEVKLKTSMFCQNYRTLKEWQGSTKENRYMQQDHLIFDSKFEGGNLLCAFHSLKSEHTYVLFMQNDTNSYGYNQWFNFSIKNAKAGQKYVLKIVNFKKRYSFFTQGMRPLFFSLQESNNGNGWYRAGDNIRYYKSEFQEKNCPPYYTLQFQISFDHSNDYIMVSPSPPYSYSKLIYFLKQSQSRSNEKGISFKLSSISKTLGGNQVPYLIISKNTESLERKPIIVIIARQHSGETWSSYVTQQFIKGIVEESSPFNAWILQNYDFHIFPMINVDGVIYGNFRCDLGGYDLNRCWKDPSINIHPHLFQIKQTIKDLSLTCKIEMFLDFHTHSKNFGAFAFSCIDSQECRRLPKIMSQVSNIFRYPACTFDITKDKQSTARALTYSLTKNVNTITIELSSFGYKNMQLRRISHFTPIIIQHLADSFINSYFYYKTNCDPREFVRLNGDQSLESDDCFSTNFIQDHQPVSGSDSEPQIDEIQLEIKLQKIFPLKVKSQFRKKKKSFKNRYLKLKKDLSQINSIQLEESQSISKDFKYNRNRVRTQYQQQKIINSESLQLSNKRLPETFTTSFVNSPKKNEVNSNKQKQKLSNTRYKIKISVDKPAKPLNLIEFSLKKLPIFGSEKINQGYQIIGQSNQPDIYSLSIINRQKTSQRIQTKNQISKIKPKEYSKLLKDMKQVNQTQQQFPLLCVMSESKKQQQIKRIKQRRQNRSEVRKEIKTYNINGVREHTVIQKFAIEKKHQGNQILSKIWFRNIAKYGGGLNINNL